MTTYSIAWFESWVGPIALQVTVAATLILAMAWLVSWTLRRSAASLRHRVWALAILGLLVYPLVQPFLPKFSLGFLTASSVAPSSAEPAAISSPFVVPDQILDDKIAAYAQQPSIVLRPALEPQTRNNRAVHLPAVKPSTRATVLHGPSILVAVWAIVVAVGLAFLLNVHRAAFRLIRTAIQPSDPSWGETAAVLATQLGIRRRVAVRISGRIAVPLTAGWLHPVLLLPIECDEWPDSRRRMVLIHELSHVARGDVLWQLAAKLACVVYWPHPLVWLAARRMRVEREAACDDAVLRDIEHPSEYASLLLDVAASLTDRPMARSTAAVAMACGRSVEERIRWIVQPGRCRLPIGRRTARWFSVGAILIVLGLGSLSLFASPPVPAESEPTTGRQRSDQERLRRTELEQHQSSPATTAERSPWYVALPNGATVELIGLAPNPSDEKPWWQPDGSLLLERPFANKHKLVFNNENRQAVDVAYRITWPDSRPCASTTRITGNLGIGSNDTMRGKNGVSGMAVVFPAAQATTDIYLGAAAGPWELAVKLGPKGGRCKRPDLPAAEFTSVEQRNGEFVVEGVLSWAWDDEFNYHLVVVGEDGSEHVFSDSRARDVKPEKKVRHWTFHDPLAKISEHPLTAIKEMRLEYRRYQFAEFKSVSLRAGVKTHVLTDAKANVFSGSDRPKATASVNAERGPILPGRIVDESGERGHTSEAEEKFEPFATLQCSGSGGGEGGLLSSTGFTFVKSSEPDAKKTRLVVSFASDRLDDDPTKYRVVAIGKDGRSFANESPESYSGRGRTTGVMTIICEFPVPDSNLEELRIVRLKDAKSTGQSNGHPISHAATKPQSAARFHLVRGNTTWIGTDNAPLQYDDYDKLCFWLWGPHTVVLPRPTEGFFDFYKERTLGPGVSRMDVSRAEWPSGQPANITMPGTIDLPTYQLLLQPSVQRALNLSKEQRTKLQNISVKYWSERRQIPGKALDDMEAKSQRELTAENARAGGPGLVRSSTVSASPFSDEVIEKLEAQWSSVRKQIEDVLTSEQLRTLKDLTFRTFAFGSGIMFEPEVLERLGVSKDQQDKLRPLELQLQKEKDRRLRSTTAEKMKNMWGVLMPEQLSELRNMQPLDQYPDCSQYPYPGLPSHMPDTGAAEELGLSAEQQASVRKIVAAHWQSLGAIQLEEQKLAISDEKGRQAISEKRRQEMANLRKQIEAALTPKQWARCNEIAFENLAAPRLRLLLQGLQTSDVKSPNEGAAAAAALLAVGLGLTSEQVAALRSIDAKYFDKPEQIYRELTDKALTAFTPAQQEKLREEVDRRGW